MKFNYLKKKIIQLTILTLNLIICSVLIEGVLIFISTDGNDYERTKEFHEKYVRYNKHVIGITNIALKNQKAYFEFSF